MNNRSFVSTYYYVNHFTTEIERKPVRTNIIRNICFYHYAKRTVIKFNLKYYAFITT